MRADQFDYDAYHRRVEQVNVTVPAFERGEFLPVCQWTLGDCFTGGTHEKEDLLPEMLDGISKTLAVKNDWIPYLEPWVGIGIFAEAFGCPFEYNEKNAPWTHAIVSNVGGLKRLQKPDIRKSKMLQTRRRKKSINCWPPTSEPFCPTGGMRIRLRENGPMRIRSYAGNCYIQKNMNQ